MSLERHAHGKSYIDHGKRYFFKIIIEFTRNAFLITSQVAFILLSAFSINILTATSTSLLSD